MDSVTIDGKTYVRAAKAARGAGYTADYVGQLCRKGKIDAVLLGKTWYVLNDALSEHKRTRIRGNAAVTRRDFEKNKQAAESVSPGGKVETRFSPYRNRLLSSAITYSSDEEELIPAVISDRNSKSQVGSNLDTDKGYVMDTQHTEEDSTLEEKAEHRIPIRQIAEPVVPADQREVSRVEKTIGNQKEDVLSLLEMRTPAAPQERALTKRRSLVPVVFAMGLFLFVVANIFLEWSWNYDSSSGEQYVGATYNLASINSILGTLKSSKFMAQ